MSTDDNAPSDRNAAGSPTPTSSEAMQLALRKIAHELRSPIGAIASSADIMRSESFGPLGDDRYKEYATSISESADFALSVVSQAIEELGSTGNASSSKLRDIDAGAIVRRALQLMHPAADDSGVRLETRLNEGVLMVHTDPVKLQQIIINAVANAIKFSPVKSCVTINGEAAGSEHVRLTVVDRGLGMGTTELSRIRQNRSTTGQGYGLMHRLCQQIGAVIEIDSRLGEGTTVRIDVPTSAKP